MENLPDMNQNLEPRKARSSEISDFYEDLNILVTGPSGFYGTLLIEKLLRACPKLGKVYMLMRSKQNKSPEQRFKEHFNDVVYERLMREQPNFSKHVVLVEGDVSLKDLGLSTKDRDMLIKNTNLIFHGAATVRFNESIRRAITINVGGLKTLLLLAKEMSNLKGFVHISTAFSNCVHDHIEEKFYEPPQDPDKMLSLLDLLNDEEFEVLQKTLMGDYPNTYIFSKALGENIVQKYNGGIPICIIRPSITISTFEEPLIGWVNNYYGPVGFCLGYWLGLVHCFLMDVSKVCDLVPADFVINNIVAAGWDLMKRGEECRKYSKPMDISIFNMVLSAENSLTWGKYIEKCKYYAQKKPTIRVMWYNCLITCKQLWLYNIVFFSLHTVPIVFVDIFMSLVGRKMTVMNIYKKMCDAQSFLHYFTLNSWTFKNNNVSNLWNRVSPTDKEIFNFDLKTLDWEKYFKNYVKGARLYILKEPDSTIPAAKRKFAGLMILHYAFCMLLLLLLAFIALSVLRLSAPWTY